MQNEQKQEREIANSVVAVGLVGFAAIGVWAVTNKITNAMAERRFERRLAKKLQKDRLSYEASITEKP